ncbi:hypothetical protein [Paenibacillus sp. IHBB 10380]|uniref:hypothetical protein n=1 Tax=Paenibacillus sp. IHBB 10380 TaxID=1566358 RepID=UPI000697E44D|nr:hypothetical protein [Paenibacillus sp. IHBB 10380]
MLPNVRLATISDADALSKLNLEFNGGDKRAVSEIIECLNSNNELVAVATLMDKCLQNFCPTSKPNNFLIYENPYIASVTAKGLILHRGVAGRR